jgi:periplasmic protein TonB
MNAGLVEWGVIAKSVGAKGIAYTGTLTGTLGRGALLLSAVVHGGLAAAFIGWGDPQPTPPQPIPIAIVAVASGDAPDGTSPPVVAQAPHQPATRAAETEEPAQAAMPEPPVAPLPQSAAPERMEPVPLASEPVADMALPAIEPLPAPAAKPAGPPAEQVAAAEPAIEPAPQSAAEPVAPAMIETAAPETASETATETATETAPAIAAPTAGQTAALPAPASALGTAPDTLETGSADFEPARYDVAALANPEPDYPWASRRAGEQGRVVLRVEVSAAGIVEAIEVADSSGHRRLDAAALEAVRQWRFEPARVGDRAIATTVSVPVTFRLE